MILEVDSGVYIDLEDVLGIKQRKEDPFPILLLPGHEIAVTKLRFETLLGQLRNKRVTHTDLGY